MTTNAPNIETPSGEAKPELFSSVIPEEFREKPYLKDFLAKPVGPETYKELFKKLDGAETLIGKKLGVPAMDAPEAEWDAHFAKLRPAKADEYEVTAGEEADPKFIQAVREAFFEGGATKGQAKKIITKIQAAMSANSAEQVAAQKAHDEAFDALVKTAFGAEEEKKLGVAKAMIAEFTPEAMKPFIGKVTNESLVILAGVLNAVKAKYGVEDSLNPGGAANGGGDVNALYAEGQKLQASAEYRDFQHPKHQETVDRVNAIFKEVAAKKK